MSDRSRLSAWPFGALLRVTLLAWLAPFALSAQSVPVIAPAPTPFVVGEELVYQASLGRYGGSGRGRMRVSAIEDVRGRATWVLRFEMRGRVAGLRVEDETRSWLDAERMSALRFTKREHSPLASFAESVEIYPDRGRWVAASDSGEIGTDAPLDELSFIYFVRTLSLANGDDDRYDRHFDASRNPTRVRVVGRETVTVPAGRFETIIVEMYVRDERRYGGIGVVRLNLTDDTRRIPVRIQSHMRRAGTTVLALESITAGTVGTR